MTRRSAGEGTIYRRKDGRYEAAAYVRTPAGTRKRVRAYGSTRVEAHEQLVQLLDQGRRGIPVPEKSWRVGAYLDYWLPIVKQTRRPTTYLLYKQTVDNYLKPNLGSRSLTRLSVADLQRYLDGQHADGRSVRTIQKQRTVLSAALTRALREELVSRNVARLVELPSWKRRDIRPWSVAELGAFLRAAQADPLYPAFVLLALYGLRRGEVLGLRWTDVDFGQNRLRVRQQLQRYDGELHLGPPKTHAGQRDLPLLDAARAVLLGMPGRPSDHESSALLFTTRFDNPIEPGNLLKSLRRISDRENLPRITVHHLRHTTATLLKNIGVPARDTQLILGHAHINTTQQLYQHADLTGQTSALRKLEAAIIDQPSTEGHSRQKQPSKRYYRTKSISLQQKYLCITEVLSGGSSQTRTWGHAALQLIGRHSSEDPDRGKAAR